MDDKKIYCGDEDEWAARLRLNQKAPVSAPAPAAAPPPTILPSFALAAAATRGDMASVKHHLDNRADVLHDDCKALRMAVSNGHYSIAELLLQEGSIADALDGAPMLAAVGRNDVKTVALLLKYKADPNYSDAQALRRAALLGLTEVAAELVKGGADPFATPFKPNTVAMNRADDGGFPHTADYLDGVMKAQRQKFLSDMGAAPDSAKFMRAPYGDTREPALVRAIKMECLDEAVAQMKKSQDTLRAEELLNMQDRGKRPLRQIAAEHGVLLKLFDPLLWNSNVAAMRSAWDAFPKQWFESGMLDQGAFDDIVAGQRQKVLKSKAHKYKI